MKLDPDELIQRAIDLGLIIAKPDGLYSADEDRYVELLSDPPPNSEMVMKFVGCVLDRRDTRMRNN